MTNPPEKTGHEARVERRKQRILEAAARLFAENGFHRTSTRDIAEAADVGEGTIYNYFENKDGLLMALMNSLAALQERQAVFDESFEQNIYAFFEAYFLQRMNYLGDNYHIFLAVLPEILNTPDLRQRYMGELLKPAMDMIEKHLIARGEKGLIEPLDFSLYTRFMVATLLGLQMLLVLGDEKLNERWQQPATMSDDLIRYLISALEKDPSKPDQ